MRAVGRTGGRARWTVVVLATIAAVAVHRRFPWVRPAYLAALVVVPVAGWRLARWRAAPRSVRWSAPAVASLSMLALCPVPWLEANLDQPPGSAWRLDKRLVINGVTVDPPGTWYWLSAGRPPIMAELVKGWLFDSSARPTSLRDGRLAQRPFVSEPAAAAVGLQRAGWPIELTAIVELSGPVDERLPQQAVLVTLNDRSPGTREDWEAAFGELGEQNTIVTAAGDSYSFSGPSIPFRRVDVIEVPRDGVDAAVGGRLARTLPGSWFRHLAVGSSHGMMVALVSYVHGSGDDLAAGRAIAGTGTIGSDGSIGPIGGLVAKATAARDVGADVLLFPAAQAPLLDGFDAGSMRLLPVATLDDAIAALRGGDGH